LPERSRRFSLARKARTLSHECLEGAALRIGALTDGGEATLRCKELGLNTTTLELPLGQYQGGLGDPLSAGHCAGIASKARRRRQGTPCLLERAFGILGVLSCLELAESMLELGESRLQTCVVG
jgi:hypothetical protein